MLPLALALVRAWTRLLTWRMPSAEGDRRREEIDSDLWELEHDPQRPRDAQAAMRVLARLVLGMPHDIAWRAGHVSLPSRTTLHRVAIPLVEVTAVVGLLAALLLNEALKVQTLPAVPPAPPPEVLRLSVRMPPVPPPPPPLRREGAREPDPR